MAKTFLQMAQDAMGQVEGIAPADAQEQLKAEPATLVVDVRDAADTLQTGVIPGALNISLGMLAVRADQELPEELRAPELQDRARPIITTCALGPNGARGASELKEMGFSNVRYLEGGVDAWSSAGLPMQEPTSA